MVVVIGVVAAKRELKAVLALGRTVASACVTAGLTQDRHHLADKAHAWRCDACDLHRYSGLRTARTDDKHRLPNLQRLHEPVGVYPDNGSLRLYLRDAGEI